MEIGAESMLRLAGCVLVIAGSAGFAQSICRDSKKRLEMLKQMRSIFEAMKYYIAYQKATIPEILGKLSVKGDGSISGAFQEIYRKVYEEGESFPLIWKQQMEQVLMQSALTKEEKKMVLDFPSCLEFMEENAQAGALDELLREINLHIEELIREQKNKNKMIMSLGVAVGVLISILLI